jgi:hypothetical protein
MLIVAVDVDDMTIAGSSKAIVQAFKDALRQEFKIKDLGELKWLLGIEVKRDRHTRTISFSQRTYIDTIISRFNLQDAKPLSMPIDPHHMLSASQCPSTPHQVEDMRKIPFREGIGSLMYAAQGTRPDIAFAISFLSQFMQNPGRPHWEAVKRVFRYLKGTRDHWLTIGNKINNDQRNLEGFTDADWGSQEHRHSISGYIFMLDGGAVSWSSKKQPIVALSSMESEYIATTHATKEALWIRTFISEITRPLTRPIILNCDNQSAIAISKNDEHHARTKHIDIRYHFIRSVSAEGLIELKYVPTDDNPADMFTKALARSKLQHLTPLIGMCSD